MKNIYKIFALIAVVTLFASCDDEVPRTIYSDEDGSFVSFVSSNVSSFPISIDDATGSLDLSISASDLSDMDRSYNLVLDTEATTADPSTFNLPSSVTIPSGSYFGTFTIEIINNDDLDSSPKNIVFGLEETGDFDIDSNIASISIFEVCPVPETFMVGDYNIQDVNATIGPGNGTENFASGTVTLVAASSTSRTFEVAILPAFRGPVTVTLDLVCNTLILNPVGPEPAISCTGAGEYTFADDGNNTYSVDTGDDLFTITYIEDVSGDCGGPYASSFSLTKL